MIKLILSLTLIGFIQNFMAQETEQGFLVGKVVSDTSSCKDERYSFGLGSILKSEYPIEIRFISSGFRGFSGAVLYYDSLWLLKIRPFEFRSNMTGWKTKEETRNLDSLFAELVANNIFSLPNQNDLNMEKYYYNPKTDEFIGTGMGVGCGAGYIIEFKIGDKYRRYDCSNPDLFADFYPSVYELKNYVHIVQIFDTLIKE